MSIRCPGADDCGLCLDVCPRGCITRGAPAKNAAGDDIVYPQVDKTGCDECGKCAQVCKPSALYMCGRDMTLDEVMEKVERDKPFYEDSGGGVTVSGGECLCQPEFTVELLRRCKAEDVHTAVDTTGFVPWEIIERALPYTDLFLYDLKCMDSALHKRVIGVPNERILENAEKLARAGGQMWIRIPVMPLFNDSEEHFGRYGAFLDKLRKAVVLIQLLPYHKMGLSKYERLLDRRPVFAAEPPPDALLEARKAQLEALRFKVRIH
jgi:pyruvate formate lyase activating enzyme